MKINPIENLVKTNPIQTQFLKMQNVITNVTIRAYENEIACALRRNKPNQTQSCSELAEPISSVILLKWVITSSIDIAIGLGVV